MKRPLTALAVIITAAAAGATWYSESSKPQRSG